jgi:phage shock protein PspC (stress-responsive transcriptional regulator)
MRRNPRRGQACGMNEITSPQQPDVPPPAQGGADQPSQHRWDDRLAEIWRTRPRRFPKHGYVAGVSAGVALRYGLDPLVVRIAFVLSAVFGGLGVPVYVAAWLLLPRDADEVSALGALFGKGRSTVAKWKTVLLCLVFLVTLSQLTWHDAVVNGLWLVGLFLAFWFLHRAAPVPPAGTPSAATALDDPAFAQFATQEPAVSPRRRRGVLAAVGAVFLVAFIAGLAFFGWLFSTGDREGRVGDQSFTVRTDAELQNSYSSGVGTVKLDLSGLDLTRDRTVRVESRFGEVDVWVPDQANVRALCHVGRFGEAKCGGAGVQSPGKPTLTLELSTQLGELRVHRGAPASLSPR